MSDLMPALFIGHGSPMNAIEDNEFSRAWTDAAAALPRPQAVLCVSAHWETNGVMVTAMENPRTIHDFYGFPEELFAVQYRAPGSPEIAEAVRAVARSAEVSPDMKWGLDHGACELGKLREEGVLVLGSGNIVHNLGMADFSATAYDWALSFDGKVAQWIEDGNHQAVIHGKEQGRDARLSVNTAEHYKPLL